MNTKSMFKSRLKTHALGLLVLTVAVTFLGAFALGSLIFMSKECSVRQEAKQPSVLAGRSLVGPQIAVATELDEVDVAAIDEVAQKDQQELGRSLIPGADETGDATNAGTAGADAGADVVHPTVDDLAIEGIQEIEVLLYKIFRSPDGYAALVGAGLNEDVPLPAMTEIQVPTGVEILWFGDIAGGPRSDDRQFPTPYDMRTENGFDIYTVIVNYHVFQLEYLIDGEPFENLGGGDHVFHLQYTPLHDAAVLRLAAYLPMGSVVRDPSFTHLGFAPATDEPLYGITFTSVQGGETYSADLIYGPPATIARQGSDHLEGGILATIGIIVAALGAAAAVFFIARSRRQREEEYADANHDYDDISGDGDHDYDDYNDDGDSEEQDEGTT